MVKTHVEKPTVFLAGKIRKEMLGNSECSGGILSGTEPELTLNQKCIEEAQCNSKKIKHTETRAAAQKAEFSVQTLPRKLSTKAKQ